MGKCPTCQKDYTDKENKEAIEKLGECLICDHVRPSMEWFFDEQRKETQENENNSFDV